MSKIRFGDYYIVDVSYDKDLPIHRVIASVENERIPVFRLYSSGYEVPIEVNPEKDTYYFRKIKKIQDMKVKEALPAIRLLEY